MFVLLCGGTGTFIDLHHPLIHFIDSDSCSLVFLNGAGMVCEEATLNELLLHRRQSRYRLVLIGKKPLRHDVLLELVKAATMGLLKVWGSRLLRGHHQLVVLTVRRAGRC